MGCATGLLLAAVLPLFLVASLAVAIRSNFEFTDPQLGAAVGISFAVSAVVSPTAGRAVDRIGVRLAVIVFAVLVGVSAIALATIANSSAAVIALMAVNGLGSGIGVPSLSSLLASEVGVRRHGTAFGMFTSAPQMALFAAGLALPLVAEPLDWRAAFALPALIGGPCFIGLMRHGVPSSKPADALDSARCRRRLRSVHGIALSAALASAAGIGMRSFLVVFAVSVGFGRGDAGLLLAMTGLLAIASRLGFGVLGDRRPGTPLRRAAALMALGGVGFTLMALGGKVVIILGALLAGGVGWGWQSPLSLAVVTQNRDATAAAIGIQMSGFYAGAAVGPLGIGLLAGHGSYTGAWVLCVGLSAAAAVVALVAPRLSPRQSRSRTGT